MTTTDSNCLTELVDAERQVFVYSEPPLCTATRFGLGAAYTLTKRRLRNLLPDWRRWLAEYVCPLRELPDPEQPFDGEGGSRASMIFRRTC